MATDTATALAKIDSEFDEEQKKLLAQRNKKREAVLSKLQQDLSSAFDEAYKVFETVRKPYRDEVFGKVLSGSSVRRFGLSYHKDGRNGRTPAKVSDEQIITFLSSEHTTGEVQTHFNVSQVTVGKRLKALEKAGKVKMTPDGTSKLWKAA